MTTTLQHPAETGNDDSTRSDPHEDGHDWRAAGEAWGHAAADWATLFEHYSVEVVDAIAGSLGIGDRTRLLDVACGSGWATRRMAARGATVAGIDAAHRLVDVARDRLPDSEIVHGSMFDLPWPDAWFDTVTSINGIWGGCEPALAEAKRVLRPGGRIAISFWGRGEPFDLRPYFLAIAGHLDQGHIDGMIQTDGIGKPGVAEAMLEQAGFEVEQRGRRMSILEWPDADTAWRALRSTGPVVPALAGTDEAIVKHEVLAALEHCRTSFGGYRFRNVQDFVIATTSD